LKRSLQSFAARVKSGLPIRGHGYQPVTIELDFMDPVFAAWRRGHQRGELRRNKSGGASPFPTWGGSTCRAGAAYAFFKRLHRIDRFGG
jgi:hypothetical protein